MLLNKGDRFQCRIRTKRHYGSRTIMVRDNATWQQITLKRTTTTWDDARQLHPTRFVVHFVAKSTSATGAGCSCCSPRDASERRGSVDSHTLLDYRCATAINTFSRNSQDLGARVRDNPWSLGISEPIQTHSRAYISRRQKRASSTS